LPPKRFCVDPEPQNMRLSTADPSRIIFCHRKDFSILVVTMIFFPATEPLTTTPEDNQPPCDSEHHLQFPSTMSQENYAASQSSIASQLSVTMSRSEETSDSQTSVSSAAKEFCDSQSVASSGLSSVPSDIFTPRLGSNPAERDTASEASRDIPAVFQGKKKARTSHIWSPENGCEIEVNGIRRWRCNRCKHELPLLHLIS
jgi:hypothetical protein